MEIDAHILGMQLSEQRRLLQITGDFLDYGPERLQILPFDPTKGNFQGVDAQHLL